uniref:Uncharacterized protein n=1 Tax=Oryza brachyantha TaxID=4533 RepID=J3MRU4_ORYBR
MLLGGINGGLERYILMWNFRKRRIFFYSINVVHWHVHYQWIILVLALFCSHM